MKFLSCVAMLCLVASPALANARLIKSSPANGAKVRSPHRIVLTFSEALEPAFSGALLLDKDGRNLNGDPVKVSGKLITITRHAGRFDRRSKVGHRRIVNLPAHLIVVAIPHDAQRKKLPQLGFLTQLGLALTVAAAVELGPTIARLRV